MATARPRTHSPIAQAFAAGGENRRSRLHDGTEVALQTVDVQPHGAISGDQRAAVTARVGDRVAGHVSYERVYGPRAVIRIDVDDAYWHRGLPELLLDALGARASALGITTFLIRADARDIRLIALLRNHFAARGERDGDDVRLECPATGRSGWTTPDHGRSSPSPVHR